MGGPDYYSVRGSVNSPQLEQFLFLMRGLLVTTLYHILWAHKTNLTPAPPSPDERNNSLVLRTWLSTICLLCPWTIGNFHFDVRSTTPLGLSWSNQVSASRTSSKRMQQSNWPKRNIHPYAWISQLGIIQPSFNISIIKYLRIWYCIQNMQHGAQKTNRSDKNQNNIEIQE